MLASRCMYVYVSSRLLSINLAGQVFFCGFCYFSVMDVEDLESGPTYEEIRSSVEEIRSSVEEIRSTTRSGRRTAR